MSFRKLAVVGTIFVISAFNYGCTRNRSSSPGPGTTAATGAGGTVPAPDPEVYKKACATDLYNLCRGEEGAARCLNKNRRKVTKACWDALEVYDKALEATKR